MIIHRSSSTFVQRCTRGLPRTSEFNGNGLTRRFRSQNFVVAVVVLMISTGPNVVTSQQADLGGGIDGITKFNTPAASVGVSINQNEVALHENWQHRTRHEDDASSSASAVIVLVFMGVMYATLIIVGAVEASRMDSDDSVSTTTAKTMRTCSSGDTEYEQISTVDHDEETPVGKKYQCHEIHNTVERHDEEEGAGSSTRADSLISMENIAPEADSDEASTGNVNKEDEGPNIEEPQAFLNSNRRRALTDVYVQVPTERKPSIVVRKLRGAAEDYYCYEFGDTDSETTEEGDEKSCITVVLDQDHADDDDLVFFDDDPIFHIIL